MRTTTTPASTMPRNAFSLITGLCSVSALALVCAFAPGCHNADTTDDNDNTVANSNESTANNGDNAASGNNGASESDGSNSASGNNDAAGNNDSDEDCLLPPPPQEIYFDNIAVGDALADFAGEDIVKGGTISTEALRGKYVLIEFWASWCPVCKRIGESFLKPLYDDVASGADAKLEIISVGVNFDDTAAKQARYVQSKGYGWSYLHDESGDIVASFGVGGQPAFVLVDPEGTIVTFGITREEFHTKLGEYVRQECVQTN